MKIILKSFENLKSLLNLITEENREYLDEWFYNATDNDLKHAIAFLNSKEILENYPRHHLKVYSDFARHLLKGHIPTSPTNKDLKSSTKVHYTISRGCFAISSILSSVVLEIFKSSFKRIAILGLTQTRVQFTCEILQFTKPISEFSRILMSKVVALFKIGFFRLKKRNLTHRKIHLTALQKKKLKLKCVREMIKKGKVNLEQRAFWVWAVLTEESLYGKISSLKEDWKLVRQIAYDGNSRYFLCLKSYFDRWKALMPMTVHSLLSISPDSMFRPTQKSFLKYRFKKRLKVKFKPLLRLAYDPISEAFGKVKEYSEMLKKLCEFKVKLLVIKPHIRNLIHIHSRVLKDAFHKWNQLEYEYQYEEVVVTVSKESKNFNVFFKPIVLLDYFDERKDVKILIRNLHHILAKKLRVFWNSWNRTVKPELNFSAEVTLDISLYKLSSARYEKLKVFVKHFLAIAESRKNLPGIILSEWIQVTSKKLLTLSKLRALVKRKLGFKEVKQRALIAFQINSRVQSEFTDIF